MDFIKKINNYLLEQYPLIWNTRLVWMFGVSIITHIVFFLVGYFSVNNQIDIESKYRLSSFYFNTSIVFLNILLSIIILLIWIIYYIQNNAFKNLYSIKKGTLFAQFSIIILIISINITQYYSFDQGLKLKIRNLYSWEEIDSDIKEFNKTGVFVIQNASNYSISEKKYPKPFPLKFDSTSNYLSEKIDTTKAYFNHNGVYYQFYDIDLELIAKDQSESAVVVEYSSTEERYKRVARKFKYRVVKDVSYYKEDVVPCLLNYSKPLYSYGQDSLDLENRMTYYEDFFERADERAIKNELQSFLSLADKYKIRNNLNVDDWYLLLDENNYSYRKNIKEDTEITRTYQIEKIAKTRRNYPITQYILTNKPSKWDAEKYHFTKKQTVENRIVEEYPIGSYYKNSTSKKRIYRAYSKYKEVIFEEAPYCDFGSLDRFFKNTHEAYFSSSNEESLYFYVIMTLIFGTLLFLFKITDIKTLLLSFVAGAVILIITGLLVAYMPRSIKSILGTNITENLIVVIIGLSIIIASILSFNSKWKKLITAILFSLSFFAIPLVLMFLIMVYERSLDYDYKKINLLYIWIKKYGFWLAILVWVTSIALYTKAIRKWKALPK